ncbi:hypothetical protein JB92DRAFT_3149405 [Gautieria morchelliformis]|nr:hypothetical protein JB92DRAFT_3149405 [Gautieria morchelliformis]
MANPHHAPPPPQPPPGRHRLYIPDAIVAGLPDALGPQDAPLPPNRWHQFPLPQPLGTPLPESLACKPLHHAIVRTQPRGHTSTAAQVRNLPRRAQLHFVRRCIPMWDNLIDYCDPNGAGVPIVAPPQVAQTRRTVHTRLNLNVNNTLCPLPNGPQQAEVIDRLFGWFIGHARRKPAAITSEPSVQDEVHTQIIEPLNMLLETRYVSRNRPGLGTDSPFYPQWGRSCPQAHLTPNVRSKAGFPDFLLYESPQQYHHACVMEVKTWWTYTDEDFMEIFSQQGAVRTTGVFLWDGDSQPAIMLRQLWGELHFFQTTWGACTNGHKIIIFAKTSQNELTISEVHDFDEPLLHEALLGMCFASIDEKLGAPFVMDSLCPPQRRESMW